jgi:hypothetical protein
MRPGATGAFPGNPGGIVGTAINHDECDSFIGAHKLVMSTCEKMPSPAVLDLLLPKIRPPVSRLINCRAFATRHHGA